MRRRARWRQLFLSGRKRTYKVREGECKVSEELIVRHCSPTLAGIKTGSLFSCEYENEKNLRDEIRSLNAILTPRGLRMLPMKRCGERALIYLYRPEKLAQDLADAKARSLLKSCGYQSSHAARQVVHLIRRLRESSEFPHEIGLFLGYPPTDVRGFIENRGRNCKYTGYWKVYADEDNACRLFQKYRKCTEIYTRKCAEGTPINRLIPAG